MIDLKQFARLLEEDEEGRGRIAEILASEIALRNRRIIIEAVLREVATKEDLKELEERLRGELNATRKDLAEVEERLRGELNATRKDLAEVEERLRRDLKEYVDLRFQAFEEKFDQRMNGMEEKLYGELRSMEEKLDQRMNGMEGRFNERLSGMEAKFNERFSSLEKRFELLTRFTVATFVGIMLTLVSVVLTRLL